MREITGELVGEKEGIFDYERECVSCSPVFLEILGGEVSGKR